MKMHYLSTKIEYHGNNQPNRQRNDISFVSRAKLQKKLIENLKKKTDNICMLI